MNQEQILTAQLACKLLIHHRVHNPVSEITLKDIKKVVHEAKEIIIQAKK